MKTVLVTGAHGFLGRYTARSFKEHGYNVIGIGHGHWELEHPGHYGINLWIEADVDYYSLVKIKEPLACVIHCAGGSSVGYSVSFPLADFHRTVTSSINVFEYIRQHQPQARLIYPSSAAVYGRKENVPLRENASTEPVSPYGFHKKMVEDMCHSYRVNYGISATIVRFFSIYGPGLKKQLLWDACHKLDQAADKDKVVFFGTGEETRDWIHVEDAAALIFKLAGADEELKVVNGGSGESRTVREIIEYLVDQLDSQAIITFNQICRDGDPQHYWADISRAIGTGWGPRIDLEKGLKQYVEWYRR